MELGLLSMKEETHPKNGISITFVLKTVVLINVLMKNLKTAATILIAAGMILTVSCAKDECAYSEGESISIPCEEICNSIEDFEDDSLGSLGNWIGIATQNSSSIISLGGSNVLYAGNTFAGGAWIYNQTDYPTDLISAGCEIQYDVRLTIFAFTPTNSPHKMGASNSAIVASSLTVFQGGPPPTFTKSAVFILTSPHLITSGAAMKTIRVPLELASTSGSTLPSNAYGEWSMTGTTGSSYTLAQITDFNSLMQNNTGIGFLLDYGQNSGNSWFYDNFCIKNCCID